MAWLVRVLLFLAGIVTGWFVSRDALNYEIVQFAVVLLAIVALAVVAFYFERISRFFRRS